MVNNRFLDVIKILLEHDDYITINAISKRLQVSNKTIRNDLKQVEEWLKENDLTLVKKTGVGVTILGKQDAKVHVMHLMQQKNAQSIDYSPQFRKIYIGMRLILCPQNCRIYELANELYVSRATIHKDLLALAPMLETYKITLHRKNNNGLSVEGKERNYRAMLLELMNHDNGYQKFTAMIKDPDFPCTGDFVFPALDYIDDEIKEFLQVLKHSENSYLHTLLCPSLFQVLLHLFICFIRVREGHYVSLSDPFIEELKSKPFYEETKKLIQALEEYYHISFSETEIRYLQVFLISLQSSSDTAKDEQEEARELSDLLIAEWEKHLNYSFHEDTELKSALYAHLCPAITRFRHGISIENPLMYEIKTLYKNTFSNAKASAHILTERYQAPISDEEIGYFALHLAMALERAKKPLRTVLICHDSSSATKLLKRKLMTQFPELDIVAVQSYLTVHDFPFHEIDLILSTMELNLDNDIPFIVINPLLYDCDIAHLKTIITSYFQKKNDPLLKAVQQKQAR